MQNTYLYKPADLLPHEPPLILVDRIISLDKKGAVAVADIKPSWPLFHNGQVPVIILIEALAQVAGIWAGWKRISDDKTPPVGYLVGIKKASFHADFINKGASLEISTKVYVQRNNFIVMDCMGRLSGNKVLEACLQLVQAGDDSKGVK